MKEQKKQNSKHKIPKTNNGITLIALVITIIVMLILVAVTITMAVNGGLFEYARNAGTKTNEAIAKEQELANLEENMTVDELIDKYTGGSGTGGGLASLPAYSPDLLDSTTGVLTDKATYTVEGEGFAIIPKGFKVLETEGTTIAGGLVITDSNETDESGENLGNQFVWIPVAKAIVTESEIAKIIKDSENTDEVIDNAVDAVQSLVNRGIYPMAVQDGANYKGILYNFTHNSDDSLTLTVKDWNTTDSYREPANLEANYYDYSTSSTLEFKYDSQEAFTKHGLGTYSNTLYQSSFNSMVKSVAANGGFYVGRYEISNEDNLEYVESKKGKTALVSTTWYDIYKLEKAYAEQNTGLGVTSEMIWGSQWDQMMLFVNGKDDGVSTPESPSKFYVAQSGSRYSGSSETKTGMNTKGDEVANIFDLEASRFEWTQEANSSLNRVRHGGFYGGSSYASGRGYVKPSLSDYGYTSSRASLYLQ